MTNAQKALLVLAIHHAARKQPFLEIAKHAFRALHERLQMEKEPAMEIAFKTAFRVFRGKVGLYDNDIGYAFPKDAAYLSGYRMAKQLQEKGLYDYLMLGMSTPGDLLTVATNYMPDIEVLPYVNLHIAEKLAETFN